MQNEKHPGRGGATQGKNQHSNINSKDNKSFVETACDIDRKYFIDHPGEQKYLRKRIHGEFGDKESMVGRDTPGFNAVLVTQIRPGIRTRQPAYFIPVCREGNN